MKSLESEVHALPPGYTLMRHHIAPVEANRVRITLSNRLLGPIYTSKLVCADRFALAYKSVSGGCADVQNGSYIFLTA